MEKLNGHDFLNFNTIICNELKLLDITHKVINDIFFCNIFGIDFCIINENKMLDTTIQKNLIPLYITKNEETYEIFNFISKDIYKWKSIDKISHDMSTNDCNCCKIKKQIKNDIFYVVAQGLIN
jgi:hypothetical protein